MVATTTAGPARAACVATQELTRPKNSQSDCMQNDRESQYRIQNSACGHSAPAASDCMQNGRESQYCEFLEFLGRPMNFLGRPINFLGRGSSWVVTHAPCWRQADQHQRRAPSASDSPRWSSSRAAQCRPIGESRIHWDPSSSSGQYGRSTNPSRNSYSLVSTDLRD